MTSLPEAAQSTVTAFRERTGRSPELVVRAPGRVNLLGAHVDYSEGWVLPAAIEQSVWLAAAPRSDAMLTVASLALDQQRSVAIDPPPLPVTEDGRAAEWIDLPLGVAWALAERGAAPLGLDAVIGGDLPMAAGVSSSAAVEMAFLLAWENLLGLTFDGRTRARIGETVENGYLGVRSGLMDPFACLHGQAGHVVFVDCRSLEHVAIALPDELTIVVADSGVRRRLAESDFNARRDQCQRAVELLTPHLPHVRALRDVTADDLDRLGHLLPEPLDRRARHVVEECARVHRGVAALRAGDLGAFGAAVAASHASVRDLYDVSIDELDVLVASALSAPGCHGARLTGAGFGGCVVAIVERSCIDALIATMRRDYGARFDHRPQFLVTDAADGAAVC